MNLALEAAKILRESGVGVRVVSMPSQELFLEQDYDYQDSVLPPDCMCYVSIEAAAPSAGTASSAATVWRSASTTSARRLRTRCWPKSSVSRRKGVIERIKDHFICSEEDDDCGCGCGCEDDDCGCGDCGCEHDHK